MLSEINRTEFNHLLLSWFLQNQRSFPWRETLNPFHILLSEKLLQQTLARPTVIKAYLHLVTRYPDPCGLAQIPVPELERVIKPLGFLYRAKEIKSMAFELCDKFNGNVPSNLTDLMSLTGIGEYSSRAVLSFAFKQDVAVVDTNVARLLYRLFGIDRPMPANPARKKWLIDLATWLLPPGQSREHNYAILDLCALICTARTPKCQKCPVQRHCVYGNQKTGCDE